MVSFNRAIFTWGDYADKCVNAVLSRHHLAKAIIYVNDPYEHPENIKDAERELRCKTQAPIPNVFMKRIDAFPTAKDFTIVTSSSGNKTWIQNLIKSALMKVSHERKIVGRTCVSLNDEQEIPEF